MDKTQFEVLITDDSEPNILLLSGIIKEQGYKVLVARNGKEALKVAINHLPNLILLDIHMPVMDGYRTCQCLKKHQKLKEIPVILISALNDLSNKVKGFKLGAVDYITKPFQREEVLARIESQLSLRAKTMQLEQTLEELKKTQVKLFQSEKMAALGVLTAGIAHELNNPINFIYNGINSVSKDIKDLFHILDELEHISNKNHSSSHVEILAQLKKDKNFSYLKKSIPQTIQDVKVGAERSTEIISSLRNFTRPDETERKSYNIQEGIDNALLLLRHKIKHGITVVKEYCANLPEVLCHPGQLNQVFMNILNNAIDSINESGNSVKTITITTKVYKSNKIAIKISDTGTGIPANIEQKIFDPFFTTKNIGKGVGLGLSISYGIIESHGGRISCCNKKSGGAEFKIILPI